MAAVTAEGSGPFCRSGRWRRRGRDRPRWRGYRRVQDRVHYLAHLPADPGHDAQLHAHAAQGACAAAACHGLGHVQRTLLLVGVALDAALLRHGFGLGGQLLRGGGLVDGGDALPQLGLRDVGILAEIEILELPA